MIINLKATTGARLRSYRFRVFRYALAFPVRDAFLSRCNFLASAVPGNGICVAQVRREPWSLASGLDDVRTAYGQILVDF